MSLPDTALDLRNTEAIRSAHERWLTPPGEEEPCDVCHGTGIKFGTGTEELWGDNCPKGCPLNIPLIKELGW